MARHVIDDSPEGLAVLLSRKHGSGDDMAPAPTHDGGSDALPAGCEDSAQDVMDAFHSGDAKALANALHDFVSLCNGEQTTATTRTKAPTDTE